jgi:hypothetical protein
MSSLNFWFEHTIDAYLEACARGADWREAVAAAEKRQGDRPRRVLTQAALKSEKGIRLSRQHIARKVGNETFPPPFKFAESRSP